MPRSGFDEARGFALSIIDRLEQIAEQTEEKLITDQYIYIRKILNVPATDTAAQDQVTPPPGVLWKVRRFAITGAVNGDFAAYIDEPQPQNLVDGDFTNAAIAAWGVTGEIYVPQGRNLVLRFYNQPNSQVCTVNLAITEIKLAE